MRRSDLGQTSSWRRRLGLDSGDVEPQEKGLDRATLESLPTFLYMNGDPQLDGLECSVCLTEFEHEEMGRMLPKCDHRFHLECIDVWLLTNTTCPLCRLSIDPTINKDGNTAALPSDAYDLPLHAVMEGSEQGGGLGSLPQHQLSLQSFGSRTWRRSISDRFTEDEQYPTSALLQGGQSHVNSHFNMEHWQVGGRSMTQIGAEVADRLVMGLECTSPSICLSSDSYQLECSSTLSAQ